MFLTAVIGFPMAVYTQTVPSLDWFTSKSIINGVFPEWGSPSRSCLCPFPRGIRVSIKVMPVIS